MRIDFDPTKEPEYGVPDEENPEWTSEEMRTAKTFEEFFPPDVVAAIKRGRGPQKAPTKQMVSMRIDVDVLEKWRATGKGWQGRINDTLAAHAPRRRRPRTAVGGKVVKPTASRRSR